MNERIRQLADKAGINYHFAFGAPCDAVTDLQLEEFAELIVKEVTDLLDREQWNKGQDWICKDGYRIIEKVEEHFGVLNG